MDMLKEFFTWNGLTTYSGLVLAVTIITQFLKGVGFIDKIPTRFVSYVFAIIVMNLALLFTTGWTWSAFALSFLNAIVVSLAANGFHDALVEEIWWRVSDKEAEYAAALAAEEAEEEDLPENGGDEV